jgi:class 3 adenylate cyclase
VADVRIGNDELVPAAPISALRGERRIATVIVADVVRSTDLLNRMGSENWVDLMSKLLQVLEAQIYRYGGQVDQFRGDGLVAFFGARNAHEDDPERAILAALAMQEGFERFKWDYEPEQSDEVKLRVGINTDELIVARVGAAGMHREDTAMGEAVALAARLEGAAEPGTILVSETTYTLAKDMFHWIELGAIQLKGIANLINVFRPLTMRTDTELLHDFQTYLHAAPLIGRYEESDLIHRRIDQVRRGKGGIILISGERGFGKTFLVRQVQLDLLQNKQLLEKFDLGCMEKTSQEDEQCVLWLHGWCSSYEQPSPFFVWRILLTSWLNLSPEDDEAAMRERLKTYCEALWPEHCHEYFASLASLLSIATEDMRRELEELDAQGSQGKLFNTIREWLIALSESVPLVISLSSVQWANRGSIDLLQEVVSLSEDHAIGWIIIYRPDQHSHVWKLQKNLLAEYPQIADRVVLDRFSREESETFVEYLLQPNKLDRETLDIIVARTEGNPLFIRELVSSLVAEGVLVKAEETQRWQLTQTITASDLPESLQSLFHERIDQLLPTEKLILQIASVVGYLFWEDVITAVAPAEANVTESLARLSRDGLIESRAINFDLGTTYAFTSTLIRDVTYESLLMAQRAEWHGTIAQFLRNFVHNREIGSSLLAYHFMMAGNLRLELLYRIDAADRARRIFANEDAYQEYTRALAVLDALQREQGGDPTRAILTQRFELVRGRIYMLYHLGRVVEAYAEARHLLTIADQLPDDPIWRIDALLMQPGVIYIDNRDMLKDGIPQAEEALRLSREIGDPHREMESLRRVSQQRFLVNDPAWREYGEEALEIAKQLGDQKTQVDLLINFADTYGLDQLDKGLTYIKKAYPIAQAIEYKGAQVELLYWLGAEFERAGDYVTLMEEFEEKRLELARELGWRLIEARSLMFIGQIRGLYLGDSDGALPYLDRAEKLWRDVDQRLFVYLRKAQIYSSLGEQEKAWQYLDLAHPLSERYVQNLARVGYELAKARINIQDGTLDSLMRSQESTGTVLKLVENENLVSRQYKMAAACMAAQARLQIAHLMRQADDPGGYEHYRCKALKTSTMAVETYNTFGFTQVIEVVSEEILFTHGLALRENGQLDEGNTYLAKAYEEWMRKLNMIPDDSPFRQSYKNMQLHQQINEFNQFPK